MHYLKMLFLIKPDKNSTFIAFAAGEEGRTWRKNRAQDKNGLITVSKMMFMSDHANFPTVGE